MEQHFTTGFSTNICFSYAANSFSEMLKEHQCDVATFAHEIFILVNLRKDAAVQISCGKHISNVVALYLKCLRAFFD
jgi:hypothetical protein